MRRTLTFILSILLFTKANTQNTFPTTGNVGIGTNSPIETLHVNGILRAEYTNAGLDFPNLRLFNVAAATSVPGEHRADIYLENTSGQLLFRNVTGRGYSFMDASATVHLLNIAESGKVGIGTANPQYKLAVNGDIGAHKIKVTITGWSDYVFDKDYKLRTLADVDLFISKYKHLPDVPSEKEVKQNGIDLGENQAVLLRKIEELTLYVIAQDKKQQQQAEEISLLKKQVNSLLEKK